MNKQILLLLAVVAVVYSDCTATPPTLEDGCAVCGGGACTSCNVANGFAATPVAGVCVCDTGFYQTSGDACTACTVGCNQCAPTGSAPPPIPTVCIACNTAGNFVANGSSCRCADGFYLDASDACQPCAPGFGAACTTCSATTCLTCSGDFAVTGSSTSCTKKCSIDRCLTCFNSTVCSQCIPNAILSVSQATCTCATTGFFSTATACTACIANCDVCVAATGCTTCSTGFVFSATTSTCVAFESRVKLVLSLLVIAVLAFAM